MKEFTANYSYTNHNFVIQNLKDSRINDEYLPAILIVKNILQRGCPTLMSKYLQQEIGSIHKDENFKKSSPLISKNKPNWERIIKGDEENDNFPAKKFYDKLIPKYLPEYKFIQNLIIPELAINDIVMKENKNFHSQQVDFYLPQAFLIIEIDGIQHDEKLQEGKDIKRDEYTEKYSIDTIRIKTYDLKAENETFINKIDLIKKRIATEIVSQKKKKEIDGTLISLDDYKNPYQNGMDISNPIYIATAIIRFQILILELLENGYLKFNEKWNFEILNEDITGYEDLAIIDLYKWFEPLFKLHKIEWINSGFYIKSVNDKNDFSTNTESIKINFSLLERYTDECQGNENIIFVRTHYLDYYRNFENDGALKIESAKFVPYDYFRISTYGTINYQLKFGNEDDDRHNLLYFLENIFLQDVKNLDFNEGQLPIIANALSGEHTIGLLPTGSGKSICYQMAAILKPAVSFIVCPLISLMLDQKDDLTSIYFNRINTITGNDDPSVKEKIQNEFSEGKNLFIFISPERFQTKIFREYFSKLVGKFPIAFAIIDEVHCLSEWGHDFRISYLILANTIMELLNKSEYRFIALTATASINVLKDIMVELEIKEENVKTLVNYTRPELEFEIKTGMKNFKYKELKQILFNLDSEIGFITQNANCKKAGIIFTQNKTNNLTTFGCYELSNEITTDLNIQTKYFYGSVPEADKEDITATEKLLKYKKEVQEEFKTNKLSLITATKAFGMGINKTNIYFTVHYGIPSSLESLYQEAGRAGRDKNIFKEQKAKSYTIFTQEETVEEIVLDKLWNPYTKISELNALQKKLKGDLGTNFFLMLNHQKDIATEKGIIKIIFDYIEYSKNIGKLEVLFDSSKQKLKKEESEKAIYRLFQLGVIKDWTIENFQSGVFTLTIGSCLLGSIKTNLENAIRKYDTTYSLHISVDSFEKCVETLLEWNLQHFFYNRKQSLKNLYENCVDFTNGKKDKEQFKKVLEDYFTFNEKTYILQHIAENPYDYEKWFEVFYKLDSNNNINNDLIGDSEIETLKYNLSRFLESYMNNPGLNLISGFVRLWLNDFENTDGSTRFESALNDINSNSNISIYILEKLLTVSVKLTPELKEELSRTLLKFYQSKDNILLINSFLNDENTWEMLLDDANKRINKIIYRLTNELKKT